MDKTPNGFNVASTQMIECTCSPGKKTLKVSFDESGCARWGVCLNCQRYGPFTPCQECTKNPKPAGCLKAKLPVGDEGEE